MKLRSTEEILDRAGRTGLHAYIDMGRPEDCNPFLALAIAFMKNFSMKLINFHVRHWAEQTSGLNSI
jgi:hypothetical protein